MTKKKYALLGVKAACRLTAALLRYLNYLFEKKFSGMTQIKTKHTQRVYLSSAILSTFSHTISNYFPDQPLAMALHPGL